MTCLTVYSQMLFLQLVICFIVIKFITTLYNLKRLLIMTLLAILSKLILMGIFMAVCAISKLNIPEFLKFLPVCHLNFVAFYTIHAFMFPNQLKFRFIMVKFWS